jgi:hypothetical protein
MFERGDPPAGWETKTSDITGSSTKVVLASIAADFEFPPEAKPSAFEMSAELRASVKDLPMSPSGATLKERAAILEDASKVQLHRNDVMDQSVNALADDLTNTSAEVNAKIDALRDDLLGQLDELRTDINNRMTLQNEENMRTERKMSSLKQANNQNQRKMATIIRRLQRLETELEIEPNEDMDLGESKDGYNDKNEEKQ